MVAAAGGVFTFNLLCGTFEKCSAGKADGTMMIFIAIIKCTGLVLNGEYGWCEFEPLDQITLGIAGGSS